MWTHTAGSEQRRDGEREGDDLARIQMTHTHTHTRTHTHTQRATPTGTCLPEEAGSVPHPHKNNNGVHRHTHSSTQLHTPHVWSLLLLPHFHLLHSILFDESTDQSEVNRDTRGARGRIKTTGRQRGLQFQTPSVI